MSRDRGNSNRGWYPQWLVSTMLVGVVIVGAMTRWALLHSVCDLKVIKMNMCRGLNREITLYEFKLGHKIVDATKNIFCAKNEGAVDHSIVTWWFKNFAQVARNSTIWQCQVGLKQWISSLYSKPYRKI